MMPSVMLYSLVVAALLGAAALGAERVLAELKRARRFVWLAALALSLAVPAYGVLGVGAERLGGERPAAGGVGTSPLAPDAQAGPPSAAVIEVAPPPYAWPRFSALSALFAAVWILSAALVGIFDVVSWLRLRRKLRGAERRSLEGVDVRVLHGHGPAVFGFLRPEIVVPPWLFTAPGTLGRVVLDHEREHIRARDPLLLLAALALVAAAPWNLVLWWQLRRLRAAVEIDCDARVLGGAVPEAPYAEALLTVQQRRARMPLGAVALIEPMTQLERRIRIMLSRHDPCQRAAALVGALAATVLLVAACAVEPPALTALVKPEPPRSDLPAHLRSVVLERYGDELRSGNGRQAYVDLVFDASGAVERSTMKWVGAGTRLYAPAELTEISADYFFVVCTEMLAGAQRCSADPNAGSPSTMVAIAVHDPAKSLEVDTSPDTEVVDRRIAERYFANVFSTPPPENSGYWVLFDRQGKTMLAAGREVLHAPFGAGALGQIRAALKERYPEAEIERVSASPVKDRQSRNVVDRAGRNVLLYTAWLAADSSLRPPTAK